MAALPLCPPVVSPVHTVLPKLTFLRMSVILDDLLSQLPFYRPGIETVKV